MRKKVEKGTGATLALAAVAVAAAAAAVAVPAAAAVLVAHQSAAVVEVPQKLNPAKLNFREDATNIKRKQKVNIEVTKNTNHVKKWIISEGNYLKFQLLCLNGVFV